LRLQREWRKTAARNIECQLIQVEADVTVPVEAASHTGMAVVIDSRVAIQDPVLTRPPS